jgi:hypothetical protein
MDITAEEVKKACTSTQLLDNAIRKILQTCKAEVIEASRNGSTNVIIPVPTNFNVGPLSNQSAQTVIYFRTLREIENKGFNVSIQMDKRSVKYCIRWDVKQDAGDMKTMNTYIATHVERNESKTKGDKLGKMNSKNRKNKSQDSEDI